MSTATAKQDDVAETARAEPVPLPPKFIKPTTVKFDFEGFFTKRWRVILPDGMGFDRARESAAWEKVRLSRQCEIGLLDRLDILLYDRSQFMEAIVIEVMPKGLKIKPSKSIDLRQSGHQYLRVGKFEVRPDGDGFAVFRWEDDVRMTLPVTNEKIAERDLSNLFPRRA